MSNIITLIPSKDRAAQLDLCIYSLLQNFNVSYICVIYKASDKKYQQGYYYVAEKYKKDNVYLIPQVTEDMKHEVYSVIQDRTSNIINFCTDDTVFYKNSNLSCYDINHILDEQICSFSPRLGLNTIIQNYQTGELQPVLNEYYHHEKIKDIIYWDWTKYYSLHNYGYPAHQDGCLMNKEFFLKISDFKWTQLRGLEGSLAIDRRHTMHSRPFMSSPIESFAVNIPVNAVQGGLYCSDKFYQSIEDMNNKYLDGNTLSFEKTDWSNIVGAHQEINIRWVSE